VSDSHLTRSSLGWDVLDWCSKWLVQPDGDQAGEPLVFTAEQVDFIVRWYEVTESGAWRYRRAQLVRPKGWGKTPIVAALSCAELGGPVRFSHFGDDGYAVGRPQPSPWVQIAAVSIDQTVNTMSLVIAMLQNAEPAMPGLDVGLTRIFTGGGRGRLEPVTASAISREGQRLTACILDETQHWLATNGGHNLAKVIRRNLGKLGGRAIETTNAFQPGQDSVAEQTHEYGQLIAEGRARNDELLVDHTMPSSPVDLSNEALTRQHLAEVYGDSLKPNGWIDPDRIMAEAWDPSNDPADVMRFYFNLIVSPQDALVTPEEWDLLKVEDDLKPGDAICLGFDGGKTDDATVLVGLRMSDRFATVIGAAEKPEGAAGDGWEVDKSYFDGLVDAAFAEFDVVGFYADVNLWETFVDRWSAEHGAKLSVKASPRSACGWDMRGRLQQLTVATERLVQGIRDKDVHHNGHKLLRRHVLNARRRPNRWGISFGKDGRESKKKVDAFAALQLADMARADALGGGWGGPKDRTVLILR
jgi:phage terminase large subunit-like protein